MDLFSDALVIGLTEQAPLVLATIGFALLYRLTGLINVAYSETITLGAYLGMWVNTTFGLNFYATLIPAGILAGLLSVGTYFLIFRPARTAGRGHARADHHLLRAVDLPALRAPIRLRVRRPVLRRPVPRTPSRCWESASRRSG